MNENAEAEIRRLNPPDVPLDQSEFVVIEVTFTASSGAKGVLDRCRDVLKVVLERSLGVWPSEDEWRLLLPSWFVDACGPELDENQVRAKTAAFRAMSWDEQRAYIPVESWSLGNWIAWFVPDEREWFWWGSGTDGEHSGFVRIQVMGFPTPTGSLSWLLRASGAGQVEILKPW